MNLFKVNNKWTRSCKTRSDNVYTGNIGTHVKYNLIRFYHNGIMTSWKIVVKIRQNYFFINNSVLFLQKMFDLVVILFTITLNARNDVFVKFIL